MALLCILGVSRGFLDNFFLLSVHASLKKENLNNLIHGGFGSTWGDNFYMGMQNFFFFLVSVLVSLKKKAN